VTDVKAASTAVTAAVLAHLKDLTTWQELWRANTPVSNAGNQFLSRWQESPENGENLPTVRALFALQ
jgi:hypothetical protein